MPLTDRDTSTNREFDTDSFILCIDRIPAVFPDRHGLTTFAPYTKPSLFTDDQVRVSELVPQIAFAPRLGVRTIEM